MKDARPLPELVDQLTALHAEAVSVLADAHHIHPSMRLALARGPIAAAEERLDALQRRFAELDAEILRHAGLPTVYNSALLHGAHIQVVAAVRTSVHEMLRDAADTLASLHSHLDFRGTLAISLSAFVIAVLALVRDLLWG
jgi:hypothetical protein